MIYITGNIDKQPYYYKTTKTFKWMKINMIIYTCFFLKKLQF